MQLVSFYKTFQEFRISAVIRCLTFCASNNRLPGFVSFLIWALKMTSVCKASNCVSIFTRGTKRAEFNGPNGAVQRVFPTACTNAKSKWKDWKSLYRHECDYSSVMIKRKHEGTISLKQQQEGAAETDKQSQTHDKEKHEFASHDGGKTEHRQSLNKHEYTHRACTVSQRLISLDSVINNRSFTGQRGQEGQRWRTQGTGWTGWSEAREQRWREEFGWRDAT